MCAAGEPGFGSSDCCWGERAEGEEYLDEEQKGFLVLAAVELDGGGHVLRGRKLRSRIPCGTARGWACG